MNNYSTPRLKSLVEFYSADGIVYFFNRPGFAIQMEDPTKFVVTVCKIMDGKKDLQQLKQILLSLFPKETLYLENLLTVLDNEYLLEDTSKNSLGNLTNYDINRWSRNIEFFGAYCKSDDNKFLYQDKLKSIKVAILGLGGVGSNILYNLVAMGVCNIKAIDYDKVELSNLNRQIIYNESDIGQIKSVAAKNRISQFLPHANIEFINKKICSVKDIEDVIVDQDIVISAIDQPRDEVMEWFNLACIKHKVPFICGALDSRVAICYTVFPGKTGCIECWKNSASKSAVLFQKLIKHKGFVSADHLCIAEQQIALL